MKTIEIISQDLFDKIRSRFENLQMGDEQGEVTMDPRQARFYDFDFTVEGKDLGRVSISINELGTLKMFYGKSILEDVDPVGRDYWYDFLREMRSFAMRRLLRFDTRDITKSNLNKDDFQYLAGKGNKENGMNESAKFTGGKMTSHRVLERTKLVVKHKKGIEDESFGARSRSANIAAIFVENEEGERFKYPFIHIAGAKAMQRHVANGGRPYDEKGNAIIDMSSKIAQLSAFHRHMGRHDGMNSEVNEIASKTTSKLENLRHQLHSLHGQRGYEAWAESFDPVSTMQGTVEMDQATMENYKSAFTVSSFKEDLAQYFPLIHSIMQEAGTVDLEEYVKEGTTCKVCKEDPCSCDDESVKENEFDIFRKWTESVAEGSLEPDTLGELVELLGSGQIAQVGVDATSTVEALNGIGIQDEDLQNELEELAKQTNGTGNPQHAILAWLEKVDPEAAAEIAQSSQQEQPAQPAPAPQQQLVPQPAVQEEEENEYEVHGQEDGGQEQPSMQDLAQWLGAFYNKDWKEQGFNGPWRKGVTELGIMAEKEFGDQYGHLVKELMSLKDGETRLERVTRKSHERKKEMESGESVLNRSNEPKMASALRKGQNVGMAEDEHFEAILRLSGLAK
jgi:hypothetical protein